MRHRVLIKDYGFNEYTAAEGWGEIVVNGIELRVFITGMKLPNILYKDDYRGKEIDVELKILPGYVSLIDIERKMLLLLTRKDVLVPKYLFMGKVIKKIKMKEGNGRIKIIFDCGIQLDIDIENGHYSGDLENSNNILVVGYLHMYGVDDLRKE